MSPPSLPDPAESTILPPFPSFSFSPARIRTFEATFPLELRPEIKLTSPAKPVKESPEESFKFPELPLVREDPEEITIPLVMASVSDAKVERDTEFPVKTIWPPRLLFTLLFPVCISTEPPSKPNPPESDIEPPLPFSGEVFEPDNILILPTLPPADRPDRIDTVPVAPS